MPRYCYKDPEGGEVIERHFSVGRAPKRVISEGRVFLRDFASELGPKPAARGYESVALGCHPGDVNTRRQQYPDTEWKDNGRPVIRSARHKESLERRMGLLD